MQYSFIFIYFSIHIHSFIARSLSQCLFVPCSALDYKVRFYLEYMGSSSRKRDQGSSKRAFRRSFCQCVCTILGCLEWTLRNNDDVILFLVHISKLHCTVCYWQYLIWNVKFFQTTTNGLKVFENIYTIILTRKKVNTILLEGPLKIKIFGEISPKQMQILFNSLGQQTCQSNFRKECFYQS